ncbi:hypothetical protein [Niabella hibiscisoli]|uniref:hypothetical protein n=1 Tax=Niabella hibiscisoli TaxID=1825928 RepID=UPI001F0F0BD2|nr:hypothetical protein [Niabella hibiscisoli]MCH5719187.1 hypothetical protein [Niabella hibiscisoli]
MKEYTKMPGFIIYQPNPRLFHICLEAGKGYYSWASEYPPTQDNRYARRIKRIKAIIPAKITESQIYDQGTYTINKGDDVSAIATKVKKTINNKSFSFILNGQILEGRFVIRQTAAGTVLQKFKDKFAREEDIFSGDLSRTISLMVPDYDPKKVKIKIARKDRKKVKKAEPPTLVEEIPEEITTDKVIGQRNYHFEIYHSDKGSKLCIVFSEDSLILILKKNKDQWQIVTPSNRSLKERKALIQHAELLYP